MEETSTMMKLNDRLQFLDQCVAGEKTRFEKLLSINVYDSFSRSYEIYRDYVRQKNTIANVSCDVDDENLILHIASSASVEDLLSESFPKRGVIPIVTDSGVDLNIKLIDTVL
jgi:hypothetical protein